MDRAPVRPPAVVPGRADDRHDAVGRDRGPEPGVIGGVARGEGLDQAPGVDPAHVARVDIGDAALDPVPALSGRADDGQVPGEVDGEAVLVIVGRVLRNEPGDLAPIVGPALVAVEDIGRALIGAAAVGAVGPDDRRVAVDGHGESEPVAVVRVGGRDSLDLAPGVGPALVAVEDVGGAFVGAPAVRPARADDGVVAVEIDRHPEQIVVGRIVGDELLDLTPGVRAALRLEEEVGRSLIITGGVIARRADEDIVPVEGQRQAEAVVIRGVRRGELEEGREDGLDRLLVLRLAPGEEQGRAGQQDGQQDPSSHGSPPHLTAQRRAKSSSWPRVRPRW